MTRRFDNIELYLAIWLIKIFHYIKSYRLFLLYYFIANPSYFMLSYPLLPTKFNGLQLQVFMSYDHY